MLIYKDIIYFSVSDRWLHPSPSNSCRGRRGMYFSCCRQTQSWEAQKSMSALGYCAATRAGSQVHWSFREMLFQIVRFLPRQASKCAASKYLWAQDSKIASVEAICPPSLPRTGSHRVVAVEALDLNCRLALSNAKIQTLDREVEVIEVGVVSLQLGVDFCRFCRTCGKCLERRSSHRYQCLEQLSSR